jgi:aquaporin Z
MGFLSMAFAFGLTVLTMAYAVGHVSGSHFNPAATIGLWAGGRFKATDIPPYVVAQAFGAVLAAAALYLIASGTEGFTVGGFASNGYGELSPAKYPLLSRWLQQERQGSAGMEQSGRVSSVLDRRRWSRTQREIMTEHHKIYAAMPQ